MKKGYGLDGYSNEKDYKNLLNSRLNSNNNIGANVNVK
jgi:hypothetical protein